MSAPDRTASGHRPPAKCGRSPESAWAHGLQDIENQTTASVVHGASPWARWWRQNLDVIRAWGLASGTAEAPGEEHQALTAPCSDPSVWFITELLHACSGQRPG